ncbi:hypothetical protein MMC32_007704 [Xylographa parallela]|nr:hypothetical protein [Xylographa parallela]
MTPAERVRRVEQAERRRDMAASVDVETDEGRATSSTTSSSTTVSTTTDRGCEDISKEECSQEHVETKTDTVVLQSTSIKREATVSSVSRHGDKKEPTKTEKDSESRDMAEAEAES